MNKKKKIILGSLVIFLLIIFVFKIDILALNSLSSGLNSFDKESNKINITFLMKPFCWLRGGVVDLKQWPDSEGFFGFCYLPLKDAGKMCSSSADCMAGCEANVTSGITEEENKQLGITIIKIVPNLEDCRNVDENANIFDCQQEVVGKCKKMPKGVRTNCESYWEKLSDKQIRYTKYNCRI